MKYRRGQRTAWRAIAGETIVLDLAAKRMYGLNETASFVWRTLETVDDFEQLLRAMAGDSPPFGPEAIASFCDELAAHGLLESGEPDSSEPETLSPESLRPAAIESPSSLDPPQILWQETLHMVAASCAFLPGQNPLCDQVPFT